MKRLTLLLLASASMITKNHAVEVELARDDQSLLPILIAPQAAPEVEEQAKSLAEGLKRITGATFAIRRDTNGKGIQFGTASEWPGLLPDRSTDLAEVLTRETYVLQSHDQGLHIIGQTTLALQNAVWDFLYRLGFRQFFPGPHWEIWPKTSLLKVDIDTVQSPDFYYRKIFLGGGTWPENRENFAIWQVRNRMVPGFVLNTGHNYNQIIGRNPVAFSSHPEYIANPGENQLKLDPSYPEVLEIVARDAVSQLKANPLSDSVSMDPSDGGGWRKDSPLGSVSNQTVTLANHVAREIQKEFPGRKVGIYAYNEHSLPPDIMVDPNVIVSVATSFLRGGHTPEELIEKWRAKGAEIGLREYLSVFSWEKDLPGRSRASDLNYVFRTIPHFYKLGVRYWVSEASNGWGAHGLGYYLSSRLLWDVKEATEKDALIDDFLERSFEQAAPEMREFFKNLSGENRPLLSEDMLGRMYRLLDQAMKKTDSPAVHRRLEDMVAYTRYVDLDLAYRNSDDQSRQKAFEKLAAFSYLERSRDIFNGLAAIRNNARRDKQLQPIMAEEQHVITQFESLPRPDMNAILEEGIKKRLNDFTPVAFSKNLVPLTGGVPKTAGRTFEPIRVRGSSKLYVYADSPDTDFLFEAKGGVIYDHLGPVSFKLYSPLHVLVDEAVATAEIPADKEWHHVKLKSPYEGLHILEVSDARGATELNWPSGQRVSWPASPEESTDVTMSGNWVFYVPKGAEILGFYSSRPQGGVISPAGKPELIMDRSKMPDYFSLKIPDGEDGKCWSFDRVKDQQLLLTVPPFFARSGEELLVPSESLPSEKD